MASAQMDLDAQYSHDIEQAIAISKESAKQEMEESQAIAASKALAAQNTVAQPKIAEATMAQSDRDVETFEGLPSNGSAKEEMEECEAIEESEPLAAGNSPAEPGHTDEEREWSEKEAAMMTLRAILPDGYVMLIYSHSVGSLLHPSFSQGQASRGGTESTLLCKTLKP